MPNPRYTAETYPHKPAIVMGASGEMVTYRQLDERADRGARLFRSLALKTADPVALLMDNCQQFLETCWAAQRAGLAFIPLPVRAQREEIAGILADSGARVLVASHGLAGRAEGLGDAAPGVQHFLMAGGVIEGYASWEEAVDGQSAEPVDDEAAGVPMFYAVGASGQPERVVPAPAGGDVDAPPALAGDVGAAFGFSEETVFLSPGPLCSPAFLLYNMMNLYQGGTSVVMEDFEPRAALALIEQHAVTHSLWEPVMLSRLLSLPQAVRDSFDAGSMQYAILTGAPCPEGLRAQMIDWWGPVLEEHRGAGVDTATPAGEVPHDPREIEGLLKTHDKVADVAVVGLSDTDAGELQAVVEPVNWADATDETAFEIMEWLHERLEHLLLPRGVKFSRSLREEFRGGARDDNPPGDA